jgi:hypothetical protein
MGLSLGESFFPFLFLSGDLIIGNIVYEFNPFGY